ncbi:hypothetical protein [Microbacterium cremeum]|uniref:hypothetical protein n=1 Tax=Microbacterium cremeum TaxID=2782169 RepID=UPI0018898E41|nr:hypothetical protein [Microbacterium cremeum]
MDWVATLGAAAITAIGTYAGVRIQHAGPRELRHAQQLSAEIERMDAASPVASFATAARDDLVVSWAVRTAVTPWSAARALTFLLLGASIALSLIALVPTLLGVIATLREQPAPAATMMSLAMTGVAAVLLTAATVPARSYNHKLRRLRQRFRTEWDLPQELQLRTFAQPIPGRAPAPAGRRGQPDDHVDLRRGA